MKKLVKPTKFEELKQKVDAYCELNYVTNGDDTTCGNYSTTDCGCWGWYTEKVSDQNDDDILF